MNIYEKMQKISNEITKVNKNLKVTYGSSSYKAVGEADVLKPVKELETKYGIYSYPSARRIVDKGTITNSKGTVSLFMRLETDYTFVNIENPEEKIVVTTYGDGVDTQDKAPRKSNDIRRQIRTFESIQNCYTEMIQTKKEVQQTTALSLKTWETRQ